MCEPIDDDTDIDRESDDDSFEEFVAETLEQAAEFDRGERDEINRGFVFDGDSSDEDQHS